MDEHHHTVHGGVHGDHGGGHGGGHCGHGGLSVHGHYSSLPYYAISTQLFQELSISIYHLPDQSLINDKSTKVLKVLYPWDLRSYYWSIISINWQD